MAFAHDSVRILQCFLQFGSHKQRQEVFEDLKGRSRLFKFNSAFGVGCLLGADANFLDSPFNLFVLLAPADDVISLCKSSYGRHVVKKLLMYG